MSAPLSTLELQAVGGNRQARAAHPRLFRDTMAVLSGLRPGFMLDYALLTPSQLAAAVAGVARALRLPLAGLCVAELGECCCLVRPSLLPSRVCSGSPPHGQQAGAAPHVMLMAFDGGHSASWAHGAQAAEATAQLLALRTGLLAATDANAERQQGCGIPTVLADGLPGWQALAPPTARGFLLGYPAVYLCHDLEGAQAASRYLSSSSLHLHSVSCELRLPQGVPAMPAGQPLLAFSVPAELAAANDWAACHAAWQAGLRERHARAVQEGLPWGELQTEVASQRPRPVAL
jgi:hypothetical protein